MAYQESQLTPAQRSRLDEFAEAFGHAPIVGGPLVADALAQIGATGGVLLHQGDDFDAEYVVILPQGAAMPVEVDVTEGVMTITLRR